MICFVNGISTKIVSVFERHFRVIRVRHSVFDYARSSFRVF